MTYIAVNKELKKETFLYIGVIESNLESMYRYKEKNMALDKKVSRREFFRRSGKLTAGVVAASAMAGPFIGSVRGANEQINLASIGIHGRGGSLMKNFAGMKGVKIHTICDIDENLWGRAVKSVKDKGHNPKTEYDLRKVFDDKDVDAVVIATPNHWHALATIWACQAGKNVYCEKPASHNIFEGRKMVEAARKYKRLVQIGFQNRSRPNTNAAIKFIHDGKLGKIYMARGLCFKPRDSFGKAADSPIPKGVHWDIFRGPAPYRPFNKLRFLYNWHWFWDTGNGDTGNQGPHQFDIARWALNKKEHPVRVKSHGGYFKFQNVCAQETPNTQTALFEYADGTLLEFGTRGLYTNPESDQRIGDIILGTEGWMEIDAGGNWKTYFGRSNKPGPDSKNIKTKDYDPSNLTNPGGDSHHLENFIAAIRAQKQDMLNCDIEVGFMSTCLPHLANISYRLGREVIFDGGKEKFVGDTEADRMLTRNYRKPYVVPEDV